MVVVDLFCWDKNLLVVVGRLVGDEKVSVVTVLGFPEVKVLIF